VSWEIYRPRFGRVPLKASARNAARADGDEMVHRQFIGIAVAVRHEKLAVKLLPTNLPGDLIRQRIGDWLSF